MWFNLNMKCYTLVTEERKKNHFLKVAKIAEKYVTAQWKPYMGNTFHIFKGNFFNKISYLMYYLYLPDLSNT